MRYLRQHPLLAKPAPFLPQWFLNTRTQNRQIHKFLRSGRVGAQEEAEAAAALAQGPAGSEMLSHKDGGWLLAPGTRCHELPRLAPGEELSSEQPGGGRRVCLQTTFCYFSSLNSPSERNSPCIPTAHTRAGARLLCDPNVLRTGALASALRCTPCRQHI